MSLDDRQAFFGLSERRISKEAEDNMEFVSAGVTGGIEHLLEHWDAGTYACARCDLPLYASADKWRGPCPWPSFRQACSKEALARVRCEEYNGYTCAVFEATRLPHHDSRRVLWNL